MDDIKATAQSTSENKTYSLESVQDIPIPIATDADLGIVRDSHGNKVSDERGLVSLNGFLSSDSVGSGINQSITAVDPTYTDVTNSTYTIILERPAVVLFLYTVAAYVVDDGANTCDGSILLSINGVKNARVSYGGGSGENTTINTRGSYYIAELPYGTNTIKLVAGLTRRDGSSSMTVGSFRSSYIVFGK